MLSNSKGCCTVTSPVLVCVAAHIRVVFMRPPGRKAVTARQKIEIVLGLERGKSQRQIATAVQLSRGAVRTWVKEWKQGGDMDTKHKSGRPQLLSQRAKLYARRLLKQPGFGGLAKAARALKAAGFTTTVVSASTLSRMLKEPLMMRPTRLVADRSRPARALTHLDTTRRLEFAKANTQRSWDNVMFTDRKRFYFRYPGSSVPRVQWHEQGHRRVVFSVNRPMCVNVYMGITKYGTTDPVFITGTSKQPTTFMTRGGNPARNITIAEYKTVMEKHLLPQGRLLMKAHGHTIWWFQQDNDPAHTHALSTIQEYNRSSTIKVKLLPKWPPHSPDLSLIENVWAVVQEQIDKLGCKSFPVFKSKLRMLLKCVPQPWLVKAYTGMPKRIQQVVNLEGGKTKH